MHLNTGPPVQIHSHPEHIPVALCPACTEKCMDRGERRERQPRMSFKRTTGRTACCSVHQLQGHSTGGSSGLFRMLLSCGRASVQIGFAR